MVVFDVTHQKGRLALSLLPEVVRPELEVAEPLPGVLRELAHPCGECKGTGLESWRKLWAAGSHSCQKLVFFPSSVSGCCGQTGVKKEGDDVWMMMMAVQSLECSPQYLAFLFHLSERHGPHHPSWRNAWTVKTSSPSFVWPGLKMASREKDSSSGEAGTQHEREMFMCCSDMSSFSLSSPLRGDTHTFVSAVQISLQTTVLFLHWSTRPFKPLRQLLSLWTQTCSLWTKPLNH